MKTTKKVASLTATIITIGSLAGGANGAVWMEMGDAGNTIATSSILPGGIDEVQGSLNVDRDLWGYNLGSAQTLTIDLGNSSFDDNLILFDSQGRGLAGDDDGRGLAGDADGGDSFLDSRITISLTAGLYYVAVGQNNIFGQSTLGSSFISNDSGVLASPTTEVLDFIGGVTGTGSYTLRFSTNSTAVPEPSSSLLLGLCALGFVVRRRRTN